MSNSITNVVLAGLGGQGVLAASDVLAEAAFRSGLDVKKSEIHGMAQRGGSVISDVRFGQDVASPMVRIGGADFLVILADDQVEVNRRALKPDGVLLTGEMIDADALQNAKSRNMAMLGLLSTYLGIGESAWLAAIEARLPAGLQQANEQAFAVGRRSRVRA